MYLISVIPSKFRYLSIPFQGLIIHQIFKNISQNPSLYPLNPSFLPNCVVQPLISLLQISSAALLLLESSFYKQGAGGRRAKMLPPPRSWLIPSLKPPFALVADQQTPQRSHLVLQAHVSALGDKALYEENASVRHHQVLLQRGGLEGQQNN